MKKENWECNCEKCIEGCWNNPGWFGSIQEIIKASKMMKISLGEFAKEYLIQEWWTGEDDVIIPAPRRNFNRGTQNAYKGGAWNTEIKKNGKGFVLASWGA